jgi:hypothetical protein
MVLKIVNDYNLLRSEIISKYPVIAISLASVFCLIYSDIKFDVHHDYYGNSMLDLLATCYKYLGDFGMSISVYFIVLGVLWLLLGFLFCILSMKVKIFLNLVANLREQLMVYQRLFNDLFVPFLTLNMLKLAHLSVLLVIYPKPFNCTVYMSWVFVCFGMPYLLKHVVNNVKY